MRPFQIICLTLILTQGAVGGARTPLYVGALFEFSEHWFKDYTPFFPKIIDRALEDIRNKSDVLQDYDLTIIYRDTKVNYSFVNLINWQLMKAFYPLLSDEIKKIVKVVFIC